MRAAFATQPGNPAVPSEDYVAAGPDWALVLDGATAPPGADSGCAHGVRWLVRGLASALTRSLADSSAPLPVMLAAAIGEVAAAHADTCDLANPDSPSSTVAMCRLAAGQLDYLVLCDSTVALRTAAGFIRVVHDDRTDRLPGGRPYSQELVRAARNKPGGFAIAQADPAAAGEAVTGSVPIEAGDEVLLATDGITRLVDVYDWTWASLFGGARRHGPSWLIDAVRAAEDSQPVPHGKAHDDATAAWLTELALPLRRHCRIMAATTVLTNCVVLGYRPLWGFTCQDVPPYQGERFALARISGSRSLDHGGMSHFRGSPVVRLGARCAQPAT